MTVETVPQDKRPRCLCCRKKLRPQYNTKTEYENAEIEYGEDPKMNPEKHCVIYERDRGKYVRYTTKTKVIAREFTGKFGRYGDGFFCGLRCAHAWAKAVATTAWGDGNKAVDLLEKVIALRGRSK